MFFPNPQSQDTIREFNQHRASVLDSLEPMSNSDSTSLNLEFPSLITNGNQKRSAHHTFSFPAKRRKGLLPLSDRNAAPEKEDNSWIDNFSLLESLYPEDSSSKPTSLAGSTNPFCHKKQQDEQRSVRELIKKALNVTSTDDIFKLPRAPENTPMTQPCTTYPDSSHLHQTGTSQADHYQHPQQQEESRVISHTQLGADDSIQTVTVSPILNPTKPLLAGDQNVPPPIDTPQQHPQPLVDSSAFTISNLKNSKEPTLLTLTSYPFRVVYANQAFSKLSSGRKASVIGESVFDTFNVEGRVLRPCLATYPTLAGRLDNAVALVPSFTDKQNNEYSVRCGLQAYPVTKRDDPSALRYFAIRFAPLGTTATRH